MRPPVRSRPAHLQILAVSWNFGWPVAAGVVVGHWIDQSLGTAPAATLVLGVGSMAASVWRLVRLARLESEARAREEADLAREPASQSPAGPAPEPGEPFPPYESSGELDEDDLEELLALNDLPDDDDREGR